MTQVLPRSPAVPPLPATDPPVQVGSFPSRSGLRREGDWNERNYRTLSLREDLV